MQTIEAVQAAQAVASSTDLSTLERALLGVLTSGVLGVGGLLTWCVKYLVPKILGLMEDRNKTLVEAVAKMSKAIDDFEVKLDQHGEKIVSEVKGQGDRLSIKLDDRRIEELRGEIKRLTERDDEGVPVTKRR